ncbi:MAG: aminoglycoside phosphotransferase family protein [Microlunatus sp.]|nr:aminoglycoside phosphotransferase family protein [Microlunatus sp.]
MLGSSGRARVLAVTDAFEAAGRAEQANARIRPVRIDGDLVRRPATEQTATVHALLRFLRDQQQLECVPDPVGICNGVDTLRYLPGVSGGQGWYHQHTDQGLASAARLLRTVHDAGRDWTPPADAVWGAPPVPADEIVCCHGDPGPWNFVWHDDQAVGLIDWDYLHPGPRVDDVAYALQWFVPCRSDEFALDWHHFAEVPDRRHRIEVFLRAYGDLPGFDVVGAVVRRMTATRDLVRRLAEQGQEPQRTWVADGALERADDEIGWVLRHRDLLTGGGP